MKGIAEIEFVLSVFVFITTVSFVVVIIAGNIPALHNTAAGESVRSRSYQYSEIIMFGEGYPRDWTATDVERIGFSSGKRYIIDENKIHELNILCAGGQSYAAVKNVLDLDFAHDMVIEATYLDGSPVTGTSGIVCGPEFSSQLRQQFHTTRIGMLESGRIIRAKFTVIA